MTKNHLGAVVSWIFTEGEVQKWARETDNKKETSREEEMLKKNEY